jgi:hypothetical protein
MSRSRSLAVIEMAAGDTIVGSTPKWGNVEVPSPAQKTFDAKGEISRPLH